MSILADELRKQYESLNPMDFYRDIFPLGELAEQGEYQKGKYCAIALEICKEKKEDGSPLVRRYSVTDGLDEIDALMWKNDNFCLMAPISYAGKTRKSINARYMYALCVEIDNLKVENKRQEGFINLMHQIDKGFLPRPTYIVASGNGLHLYYLWDSPLPLFSNVVKELQKYKRRLTIELWNRYITTSYKEQDIQQESIFQAFRMPGTITKNGDRVEVFSVGDRVSIDYMNGFVSPEFRMDSNIDYHSNLSLSKAKELYPEWYEKRVINKEPKGSWTCNRAVYDWWLNRIEYEIRVGHRYYALMLLCIYAIKCDISEDELRKDCYRLLDVFDSLTPDGSSNSFTEKDVEDALQSFYDKGLVTYPRNSVSKLSGLYIEPNKRNGRKQENHLQLARAMKKAKSELGEDVLGGRPQLIDTVFQWRLANPSGTKAQCIRETKLSKPTVYKWWNTGVVFIPHSNY